ncbi:MAG: glyoxalase [Acidobacteriota bacterium]|nr:glyoxalase [Acidobacteriota bacterium]
MHPKLLTPILLAAITVTAAAQQAPVRPKITGISHLAIYTSNPAAADHYYRVIVGATKMPDPEDPKGVRYTLSSTQFIEVLPLPAGTGINRLDHTAWNTTSAQGMRRYLAAKGWKTPAGVEKGADGSRWFTVRDPEGNQVQFVQPGSGSVPAPSAIGHHIIHVGFMVHSRAAEDTFYRSLLGFRPYWYGGRKEGELDWVSQQVPDGHDWLEYMLTPTPAGSATPPAVTQKSLGVMDHFSIGEVSVPAAYKVLKAGNRLTARHDPAPKIGLDGKYQFNIYDPDGIRLELMNFHATEKPCCSPFTAADPSE